MELDLSKAESAIGHEATAVFLSHLLGVPINVNRIKITMEINENALIFSLKERLPKGSVISCQDIEKLPYELGILRKIK